MSALAKTPRIQQIYNQWVGYSRGDLNAVYLARMLASQVAGHSVLSDTLNLPRAEFMLLLRRYFPRIKMAQLGLCLTDESRQSREEAQLTELLMMHRAAQDRCELLLACIVAAGCQGQDHLWYDLGLWSRQDLSQLMQHNFPTLVQMNHLDMKWKKFLYRQLCMDSGLSYCRSPSCCQCADYADCFGPEV